MLFSHRYIMINQSTKALMEQKNTKINQPINNNIENVVLFCLDEILDEVVNKSTFKSEVLKELNEKKVVLTPIIKT